MNPTTLFAALIRDGGILTKVIPVVLGTLLICLVLLRRRYRSDD